MKHGSKMARFSIALVISLVATMCFQGGIIGKGSLLAEAEKENLYEVAPKKTSKASAEKTTEPQTEEITEAPTEAPTEEVTEPTDAATEASTEAPTEAETMQILEIVPEDIEYISTPQEESIYVIPTEAPTQWSQELEDLYNSQYDAGYLVAIDNPDFTYYSVLQINLSDEDRALACQIVQGEAGGEGYESCCIVAQCLRDTMISLNYSSIKDVQEKCKYDGWSEEYGENAIKAVEYIFDQNQCAVAHRVMFFYATDLCASKWHETQNYLVTVNKTRYFDMW